MLIILLVLLIIGAIIGLIYLLHKFKHPRLETLNISTGGLGSGKTSSTICRIKRLLFRLYFLKKNKNINHDYIICSNFPIGYYDEELKCRYLPVLGKKIRCYDLRLDIILMEKRLPQDEVILVIDEFSKVANQFKYKNPNIEYNIDEFISNFRHYTNNKGYIFAMDQCSQNIFLQVRRRCNYCYNFVSSKKIKFLPITIFEYRRIILSDEVENILDVSHSGDEEDIRKFIFFINPFKFYDSCAYSERYLVVEKLELSDLTSFPTLKRNDLFKLNKSTKTYYKCLSYDGINDLADFNKIKEN